MFAKISQFSIERKWAQGLRLWFVRHNTMESWVPIFLALTLFTLPLSSTAKSITFAISLILIVFSASYRQALSQMMRQPWCQAAFSVVFFAIIACFWSPASFSEKILVMEKYSKLLYLPLLTVGFRDERTRHMSLLAFGSAMVMTCIISLVKQFYWDDTTGTHDPGAVFRNHIMTSYMMVIAVYICALGFLRYTGYPRLFSILLTLLLSYQILFVNTSRTGYVLYAVLAILLFVQEIPWRKWWIVTLAIISLFMASIYFSPTMKHQIHEAVSDLKRYQKRDVNTSVGYRLQFHHYALSLYHRHPWRGNGTGSFTSYFRQENPVPSWSRRLLEPHSHYLLIISEWGNLGFCIFLVFWISLFAAARRLHKTRSLAMACLVATMLGNLSDSLLFYSGTGYLFMTIMALCLGELVHEN